MGSVRKRRLSKNKQVRLLRVARTTARTAAKGEPWGLSQHAACLLPASAAMIVCELESEAMFGGEIKVDESYFSGRCKGKRGRSANPRFGPINVFGLLK